MPHPLNFEAFVNQLYMYIFPQEAKSSERQGSIDKLLAVHNNEQIRERVLAVTNDNIVAEAIFKIPLIQFYVYLDALRRDDYPRALIILRKASDEYFSLMHIALAYDSAKNKFSTDLLFIRLGGLLNENVIHYSVESIFYDDLFSVKLDEDKYKGYCIENAIYLCEAIRKKISAANDPQTPLPLNIIFSHPYQNYLSYK